MDDRLNESDFRADQGACGPISDSNIGGGTFVWPSTMRSTSGFDYSPETNYFGIDIGGLEGNLIFAADTGLVVYAAGKAADTVTPLSSITAMAGRPFMPNLTPSTFPAGSVFSRATSLARWAQPVDPPAPISIMR